MRKVNEIVAPEVKESFFYGKITSYSMDGGIQRSKDKYRFKFSITYDSGKVVNMQKTGFDTKKDADKARCLVISQLMMGTYIVDYRYSFKDVCDYYLYYYIKDKEQSYNTFFHKRNIIENYLCIWYDRKFLSVTMEDIRILVSKEYTDSVFKSLKSTLMSLYSFAMEWRIIDHNPAKFPLSDASKRRNKTTSVSKDTKRRLVYTEIQIKLLLYKCRTLYPDIYMALLFMSCAGCRISEAIAITYDDIDIGRQYVVISKQLGRSIDAKESDYGMATKTPIRTKTPGSLRRIPLPSFIINEVILARKQYEINRDICGKHFKDYGYLSCQMDGTPLTRAYVYRRYKKAVEAANLPYIHPHDLRHSYATFLRVCGDLGESGFDKVTLKSISEYLGHYDPEFTEAVYIENKYEIIDVCSTLTDICMELGAEHNVMHEIQVIDLHDELEAIFISLHN